MQQDKGLTDRITAAVAPVVVGQGFELVEAAWEKEGGRQYLRVYVDRPEGVNLDDCATISRALDEPLEAMTLAEYCLEVSSPGAERSLKTDADYTRFQGRLVQLRLSAPMPIDGKGTRTLKGRLLAHDDETLRLGVGPGETGTEVAVPRASITTARLALAMPGPNEKMEGGSRIVEL